MSIIFVYITFPDKEEAIEVAKVLLKKRLCACTNVSGPSQAAYFWPAKSKKITEEDEYVLICKTLSDKFHKIEKEVKKLHSDQVPCIVSFEAKSVSNDYRKWLEGEIEP